LSSFLINGDRAGLQRQVIPRRGLSEDIAAAVDVLVSDEAEFILGQTPNVDGGWVMH
jgi:NAD(P)-dependent dehydrogenase (short-subunit alcohol dehydrogenase family)